MNDYFDHDNPLTRHTLGRAEEVNNIFEAIAAGFDLLPGADEFGENQYAQDTGAANAYVVTLDPDPLTYYEGLRLLMKAVNANTAASTINVNGIGVKTIKRYNGDDLQVSDITAGMIVYLIYDGTNFRIVSAHGADVALAQSWATSTSVVSGGLKGARGYAQDASTSASAAASSASSASTSASNASSSASSASASAASALSQYQNFTGTYYGPLSSDPALDPNGNALGAGDLYFNTSTNRLRVYSGSAWSDATIAHTHSASEVDSGTFADARIAQSNVTQHQAALSIATSQLTGNMPDARIVASNVTQHQASLSISTSQLTGTLPDARVAQSNVTQHQAALSVATSQLTGTLPDARVAQSNVTQHQTALSIAESQISDGSILARVGANETISGAWSFSSRPQTTSAGGFLSYASSTQSGGSITVSTSDPSGTPGAGDLWIKYTA